MAEKILIVGDLGIDNYHWGHCRDFNPEAPVPIIDLKYSTSQPGMAGNVSENLKAFDFEVVELFGNRTSIKNRYMDLKSHRCLLRVDQDHFSDPVNVPKNISGYACIVISDYNKGSVDSRIVAELVSRSSCRIFMDTKIKDLASLPGVTLKINQREWNNRVSDHDDVIVTLGDKGVQYLGTRLPADPVEVHDVCGAGDTFLAGLVAGWVRTQDMDRALTAGLKASAIAVASVGTHVLDKDKAKEICDSL